MEDVHAAEQPFCWSVDIPDLTADAASQVVSAIGGNGLNLEPILVDPAVFLTLHLDRESVEALVAGLVAGPANAVSDSLRESFEDWLAWLGANRANDVE